MRPGDEGLDHLTRLRPGQGGAVNEPGEPEAMGAQRIDRITETPVVGRWYLVRALHYDRFRKGAMAWPIIGPKHTDVEFFNFDIEHYHLDVRFLTQRHLRQIGTHYVAGEFGYAFSQPCQPVTEAWNSDTKKYDRRPMPTPTLTRMQCRRTTVEYPFADRKPVAEINAKYQGATAKLTERGWICPHRKVALGNQIPDAHGVITCPLHGLRIDAETGRCVGPVTALRSGPMTAPTVPTSATEQ